MPERPPLSRRAALGLVGLGFAAAACDVDDLRPPEDDQTSTPAPTPSAGPTPDETLVDQVLVELTAAVSGLLATRRVPELRAVAVPLLRAHRRHVAALDGPATARPGPSASTLEQLRESERALRTVLTDGATRAESGALARLLASASASVSQHLAVLG